MNISNSPGADVLVVNTGDATVRFNDCPGADTLFGHSTGEIHYNNSPPTNDQVRRSHAASERAEWLRTPR